MAEEKPKYESGIYGKAEARFGGKIFVDVVRFTGKDGVERHGITLSEFYNGGEVGSTPADQRLHDPQIYLVFDNMKSVELVELALATVREMMKRDAEKENAKPVRSPEIEALLDTFLIECNLSVRLLNCAKLAGIKTVRDLCRYTKSDILKFRPFGKKSVTEAEDFLEAHNLTWGMDV